MDELERNRLAVALFKLGFNERYRAFEYLVEMINYILTVGDKKTDFDEAVQIFSAKYNLTHQSFLNSLSNVLRLHRSGVNNIYLNAKSKRANIYNRLLTVKEQVESSLDSY